MKVYKIYELPDGVEHLARLAEQEGYRFLARLVKEFASRKNCFDKPGEALFAVFNASTCIGIGGVNIDPYAKEKGVGRVRRFYVHPENRRSGVGRMLLSAIEAHSCNHFYKLHLFTDTEASALFYEKSGYIRTDGVTKVSHMKSLLV